MMSSKITVYCTSCNTAIRILPAQLGREVRCSHCKSTTILAEGEPEGTQPREKVIDLAKVVENIVTDNATPPAAEPPAKSPRRLVLRRRSMQVADSDDLTPMVDVTFLLLIFFMVTAAFALQRSLEVPPPQTESESARDRIDPDPSDNSVIVRILRDNSVQIEDRAIPSRQQLLAELREMTRPSTGIPPVDAMVVFADGQARYETVVMVLDAGNAVSMKSIQLRTEDQEDP